MDKGLFIAVVDGGAAAVLIAFGMELALNSKLRPQHV